MIEVQTLLKRIYAVFLAEYTMCCLGEGISVRKNVAMVALEHEGAGKLGCLQGFA